MKNKFTVGIREKFELQLENEKNYEITTAIRLSKSLLNGFKKVETNEMWKISCRSMGAKSKLYERIVVPTVMCGAEFRALTEQEQNKLKLWKRSA